MTNNEIVASEPALVAVLEGCAFGIRQPLLIATQTMPLSMSVDWVAIDQRVQALLNVQMANADRQPTLFFGEFLSRALSLSGTLLQGAGLTILEQGRLLGARRSSETTVSASLALPYGEAAAALCFSLLKRVNGFLWSAIEKGNSDESMLAHKRELTGLVERLRRRSPKGTNTHHFLLAAHKAGIPWRQISGPYYQFGWGRRQVWSNSSILDSTPSIGVGLARNKMACAAVLRQAGLPVPTHALARTLEHAKAVAEQIGYPVVIKPVNLDGGVGVAAGLQNVEQLELAWNSALKFSQSLLVEKHQPGRDFRLIVLDGRLVWAVGRQPAGVWGDGRQTIAELIAAENRDPRRGYHPGATLRPLVVDEEARGLLNEAGCVDATVPAPGQFVQLRRAANLSSGGTPVVVTDRVHPDNRLLAEQAAKLLRLDLAGIDLIIPDIQTSWRESGAAIIEVNAQPQLIAASQNHLYEAVLRARVPAGGRIPVIVLVGDAEAGKIADHLCRQLSDLSTNVGLASRQVLRLGDRPAGVTGLSPFHAGRALLMHRDTDALVLVIDDASVLKTGLPVDRIDMLVVVEPASAKKQDGTDWIERALSLMLPHCADAVLCSSGQTADLVKRYGAATPISPRVLGTADELVQHMAAWLNDKLQMATSADAGN